MVHDPEWKGALRTPLVTATLLGMHGAPLYYGLLAQHHAPLGLLEVSAGGLNPNADLRDAGAGLNAGGRQRVGGVSRPISSGRRGFATGRLDTASIDLTGDALTEHTSMPFSSGRRRSWD